MSAVYRSPSRVILKAALTRYALFRHASSAVGRFRPILGRRAETSPEPQSSTSVPKADNLSMANLSYHWDTANPTKSQLTLAEKFFLRFPPSLLYSAQKFRTVNMSEQPEVAFLGRSNVGKSSLLNALLGSNICHTSSKPGRTRTMNFFAVGGGDGPGKPGKLTVLDMPGYGKGSREEWGPEIMKYLTGRRQLKRAFLLVDAKHGFKRSDENLLALLRDNAISHQIILSKIDRIPLPWPPRNSSTETKRQTNSDQLHQILEEIRAKVQPGNTNRPEALGEIIGCSGEKSIKPGGQKLGINNVRWAILEATGLSKNVRRVSPSKVLVQPAEQDEDGVATIDDWDAALSSEEPIPALLAQ